MTAEIVVMNRQAVALAADSAVTIESQGGQKVWQSATKIFGLSKRHSIGFMTYGLAEFMRIPWETVIKLYRDQLGSQPLPTVEDYTETFVAFIRGNRDLFSNDEQELFFRGIIYSFYREIVAAVEARVADLIEGAGLGRRQVATLPTGC